MRRFVPASTIALVIALGTAQGAFAHYLTHGDASDTPQRLDIREASLRFHRGTNRFAFRLRTYNRFRLKRDGYVYFNLDTHGDARRDVRIKIWYDPGHAGSACDVVPSSRGRRIERPSTDFQIYPRRVACQIRTNTFRRSGHFSWRAATTRFDRFVIDQAPDGGWYAH